MSVQHTSRQNSSSALTLLISNTLLEYSEKEHSTHCVYSSVYLFLHSSRKDICPSLPSCYCNKYHDQKHALLDLSQSVMVRAGTWSRNHGGRQSIALFSGLLASTARTHLSTDGSAHSELHPPTSIISPGTLSQTCPQASLIKASIQLRIFSSQMTLHCVKLTRKTNQSQSALLVLYSNYMALAYSFPCGLLFSI